MSAASDARAIRVWHVLVLIGLVALQLWAAWGSNGTYDTYRDLFFAQRISSATEFTLIGPPIYNTIHLGPLWFYLLGFALWLFPVPVTVPMTMAALGALQFPLAYLLGRRQVGSSRIGLLFAAALALPGWANFQIVSLTHVSVVVTAILFGVFATLRYRERPNASRAALLGLALALMFHAHPTTALLIVLLGIHAGWPWRGARVFGHVAIVAAILLATIAPVILAQFGSGLADVHTLGHYAQSGLSWPSLERFAALIRALLDYGAWHIARYWLDLPLPLSRLLRALNGIIILGATAGLAYALFTRSHRSVLTAVLLLVLVAQTAFVLLLRPVTPFWMVFAHLPLIAALVALGLDTVCGIGRRSRATVGAAVALWLACSTAGSAYIASAPWQVLEAASTSGGYGLMNIAESSKGVTRVSVARLAFAQLYAIGEPLCVPVKLYGHYARFVDASFAIGARVRCGSADQIALGGMPLAGDVAWLGLRDYAWQLIGMRPQRRIGALGISHPVAVWHSPGALPIVEPRIYPPRQPHLDRRNFTIEGDADANEAILVAHRLAGYEPFSILRAEVDGRSVEPSYQDSITAVFRDPLRTRAAGPVHWRITIAATPAYTDVLSFADAGPVTR